MAHGQHAFYHTGLELDFTGLLSRDDLKFNSTVDSVRSLDIKEHRLKYEAQTDF